MTTIGNISIVQAHNRQSPVSLADKGVIIATGESRVAEWLCELIHPVMETRYTLRYAGTENEFSMLVRMQRMAVAFIEIGFFGGAIIGWLDRLCKQHPQLRIVLFTVSEKIPEDMARYLYWSKGSFISFRDEPEEIQEQLEAVFDGKKHIPEYLLQGMRDYDLLPDIEPYLTYQEIEIVRYVAREKTVGEIARFLKISVHTVQNHLRNIRDKFGIRNMVGILKLAVTQGILPEKELRSYRFKCGRLAHDRLVGKLETLRKIS
jgi:DNA-binding NarL/FixJ family response regulator